ncbi:MAG: T9SS type A sorting domain-containing protein, partial [bacterium]
IAPAGVVDSGTVVVPACSVYNYGTAAETYAVRMKVGTGYNQAATVTNHAPGTRQYVTFPGWTVTSRGSFGVSCSTELTGDQVEANNRRTGTVTVSLTDVGCVRLIAPAGVVDSGTVVVPACSVYNYGTAAESYPVRMRIGTDYDTIATATDHAPGTRLYLTFPGWTAASRDSFAVTCSTELAGDAGPANDRKAGAGLVRVLDAAAVEILAPAGTVMPGTVINPRARVRNLGNTVVSFDARFRVGTDYDQTLTATGLAPDEERELIFPAWEAPPGRHATACRTMLDGDFYPGNDEVTGEVSTVTGGWIEVARTLGPVRDGGWLARNEANGLIYAGRGYKSLDFYSYQVATNAWTALPPFPAGAKPAHKGANGVVAGGFVYFVKGYNTFEFYRYDIAAAAWERLEDVPFGNSGKKVKVSDLVHVDGDIYMLKGNKTDFLRFNTATLKWEVLPDLPAGMRPKWDKGSFLVHDGENTIYAHKAKYHELWAFDIPTLTWSATALPGMPFVGRTGRSKKAKDGSNGAFHDGAIWALKGGNTCELWRYDVAAGAWSERDTMPQVGSTGKKKRVKFGGDIVSSGDGAFYAFKANKTLEFWRYSEFAPPARPGRSGVMAGAAKTLPAGMTVTPNPLAAGHATLRYSLPQPAAATVRVYDAAGRCVLSRTLGFGRGTASVALDLRSLSAGVYLVRVEADGYTGMQKLVIKD